MLYARAGEQVTCCQGHHLMKLACDIKYESLNRQMFCDLDPRLEGIFEDGIPMPLCPDCGQLIYSENYLLYINGVERDPAHRALKRTEFYTILQRVLREENHSTKYSSPYISVTEWD